MDFYEESNVLRKNNQDNSLSDNKLMKLDSITEKRYPSSDNELSARRYFDNELNKDIILRFNQTL